ncbi:MAG: MarR family transcriptional regulator [Actinomycetes bacterium]
MTRPNPNTGWLTDEEQHAWRSMLLAYQNVFDGMDKQLRGEVKIPHAYYIILAMLSEAPERTLRMTELARLTRASQSRTSHAVAALEERGWVRREPCPSDRRGHLATLTEAGFATVVAAAPNHVAEVRRLVFDRLTPTQVHQLGEIMDSINDGQ